MRLRTLLLLATLLSGLLSCGADRLKPTVTSGQSNLASECSANHDYFPVCGDGKNDFDNISIAQCFGAKNITVGHCDCTKNTTMVCGEDWADHTECDALNANIGIVKFVPCAKASL